MENSTATRIKAVLAERRAHDLDNSSRPTSNVPGWISREDLAAELGMSLGDLNIEFSIAGQALYLAGVRTNVQIHQGAAQYGIAMCGQAVRS